MLVVIEIIVVRNFLITGVKRTDMKHYGMMMGQREDLDRLGGEGWMRKHIVLGVLKEKDHD